MSYAGVKIFGVREQNSDVYYVHTSTNGSPAISGVLKSPVRTMFGKAVSLQVSFEAD